MVMCGATFREGNEMLTNYGRAWEKPRTTMPWEVITLTPSQRAYYKDQRRFIVVPAGRRAGKTMVSTRKMIRRALTSKYPDGRYVCAAPTHDQAKQIFWRMILSYLDKALILQRHETTRTITLINGVQIQCVGMDRPERIEGSVLDGICLDEYGNMHPSAWPEHVRPALSTKGREGFAWFTGAPEGRNHYYDLALTAQENPETWGYHHWHSSEVISPEEIVHAKATLDPLTFAQEYEASFVNFEGRVYYCFDRGIQVSRNIEYDSNFDLHLCFDFNVKPGTAAVIQERPWEPNQPDISVIVDEVYIANNSSTAQVCQEILRRYRHHQGLVYIYGDATGGARRTSNVAGSDWDIVRVNLREAYADRMFVRVPTANPAERSRVNAVNSRLMAIDGSVKLRVSAKCVKTIRDFEGVVWTPKGEIDKVTVRELTHLSDGVGYYIHYRFPIMVGGVTVTSY